MDEIPIQDLEAALANNDFRQASHILFAMTMWGTDAELAMALCRRCLKSENVVLRANALQALGHTARVFGKLDEDMKEVIEKALGDPNYSIRTQAGTAASDVSDALKWEIKGYKKIAAE
jgi:HEAT repeat protein